MPLLQSQLHNTDCRKQKQCIEVLQPVQLLLHGIIDCLRNAAIHHNEMLAKMQSFLESCSESKEIATGIPEGLSFGDTLVSCPISSLAAYRTDIYRTF